MSRRILITGGTGTLGKAIVTYMLNTTAYKNNQIVIYSRDEQKQEIMARQFGFHDDIRFFIGDVRDKERLKMAMYGCTWVIHAAALKIVPALEYNPIEAIKTNINGTENVINCALEHSLGDHRDLRQQMKVMMASTDKAVYPVNLYGATKLCAEKLILAANNMVGQTGVSFGVCRYGNVAASRGSVIEVWDRAMKNMERLKITDPGMTRYWITQATAAKFVMASINSLSVHGHKLFIPYMDAYTLKDLAEAMVKYAEYTHENPIEIVGLRAGEKIHEQIITDTELAEYKFDLPAKSSEATKLSIPYLQRAVHDILMIKGE